MEREWGEGGGKGGRGDGGIRRVHGLPTFLMTVFLQYFLDYWDTLGQLIKGLVSVNLNTTF